MDNSGVYTPSDLETSTDLVWNCHTAVGSAPVESWTLADIGPG